MEISLNPRYYFDLREKKERMRPKGNPPTPLQWL